MVAGRGSGQAATPARGPSFSEPAVCSRYLLFFSTFDYTGRSLFTANPWRRPATKYARLASAAATAAAHFTANIDSEKYMASTSRCLLSICLASPLLIACLPLAAEEPTPVSFYNQIRPIFQASCHGCHQPAFNNI